MQPENPLRRPLGRTRRAQPSWILGFTVLQRPVTRRIASRRTTSSGSRHLGCSSARTCPQAPVKRPSDDEHGALRRRRRAALARRRPRRTRGSATAAPTPRRADRLSQDRPSAQARYAGGAVRRTLPRASRCNDHARRAPSRVSQGGALVRAPRSSSRTPGADHGKSAGSRARERSAASRPRCPRCRCAPPHTGTCRRECGSPRHDEHGAGQQRPPRDVIAGRDHSERAGRGDAERMHRFADRVLAQHRADGCLPITAARERCGTRALQVQVATAPADVEHLAEQERSAITKGGRERAEPMAGVGLRHRHAVRHGVADEDGDTVRCSQRIGIDTQLCGQPSLSANSRGVGADVACHGTYRPSSSRTQELSNANSGRAATLMDSRLTPPIASQTDQKGIRDVTRDRRSDLRYRSPIRGGVPAAP
jgi:hypothetical protein